ncbi:MAG: ABC transporter ATP-binding protein, partial [Gammaproteobacteria bacterium]|nr:ABC transporter ATP-binding protein [Gammaproteobacteria bacterium]
GKVMFDNRDLLKANKQSLRHIRGNSISMIFQDPMTSLNPYLTIGTQLTESLTTHKGMNKQSARMKVIESLDEVGIATPEKRINSYPHELSGGMRQRVMIAMALLTEPEILIADEPTTALDVTIQAQILRLIKQLQHDHNVGLIFISHDLGVIAGIANDVLVMEKGDIVESGKVEDIFYQTSHPYTQKLLASIPNTSKPESYHYVKDPGSGFLLQLQDLKTYFHESRSFLQSRSDVIKAVNDVSLEIYPGETLGLVGESGSGKSTIGRSIINLVDINDGKILFNGQDISSTDRSRNNRSRHEIQMIFQDPYSSLNPRMTVFDTLAEVISLRNRQNKEKIIIEVVKLMQDVGLNANQIRKYPHEFSGGQRQRIAIARALALRPRLIIADEPVSALDVTIQAQILDLLLNLIKKYRLTMIFISHDLSVVRYICDRVAVMQNGKIVETGETETLFLKPKHEYTRALLSAIPIPDPEKERQRQMDTVII